MTTAIDKLEDSEMRKAKKELRSAFMRARGVGEVDYEEAKKKILENVSIALDNYKKYFTNASGIALIYRIKIVDKSQKLITVNPRNTIEYSEWRRAVFERDNYTCQECGKTGVKLNAHHIKQYSKYAELRSVIKNGQTLCTECHSKKHPWIKCLGGKNGKNS